MNPVLIYTDSSRIAEEKEYLNRVVSYLQNVYNAFKVADIEINLSDLVLLGTFSLNFTEEAKRNQITDFVAEYLIEKAGEPDFNGVKISRAKLREILDMPDIDPIFSMIRLYQQWRRDGFGIQVELLSLTLDVVAKNVNSNTLIETRYTYYSINNFGATLTTNLITICAALNSYNTYAKANGIELSTIPVGTAGASINGVESWNGVFRPVLHFIRQKEEMHPN